MGLAKRVGNSCVVGLAFMAGCKADVEPSFRPGSSNMALSADGETVYVADSDNGTVMTVGLTSGSVASFVAGLEPTRIAQVGSDLWVTLRAAGQVAVIATSAGEMSVTDRISVGGEPYGIVASPDGKHVYVALSIANQVAEIDTSTHKVTRRFKLDHQPRWLAIHGSGQTLYVACGMRGTVYSIDLATGEIHEVATPVIERGDFNTGVINPTQPRVTGDPTISPNGSSLAIPMLYVDSAPSVGPADPMEDGNTDPNSGGVDDPSKGGGDGYAAGDPQGLTRFNPAVVVIELNADGSPREGTAQAVLVSGTAARSADQEVTHITDVSDGTVSADGSVPPGVMPPVDQAFLGETSNAVRGYLTSLTFSPDGNTVLATVEGGAAVAVVPTHPVVPGTPQTDIKDPFSGDGQFVGTTRVFVGTDEGTTGLIVGLDGTAWTWNFLGRTMSRFDTERTTQLVADSIDSGNLFAAATLFAGIDRDLEPSILSSDVLEGRRMFFSSSLPTMSSAGAGVSCATCHFEGRNDGLTWTFDSGVRQTPSLAGPVSKTAPITWTNNVGSVSHEVFLTSQGRMGGQGIVDAQTVQVAAYIDWSRDVLPVEQDKAAVARGKAIFERADTACATCHSSERLTDNGFHAMVGEASVNTPGLIGIASTAPYFHDGSAETLADVIDRSDEVGMGHTSQLSTAEREDLETYLRSL